MVTFVWIIVMERGVGKISNFQTFLTPQLLGAVVSGFKALHIAESPSPGFFDAESMEVEQDY